MIFCEIVYVNWRNFCRELFAVLTHWGVEVDTSLGSPGDDTLGACFVRRTACVRTCMILLFRRLWKNTSIIYINIIYISSIFVKVVGLRESPARPTWVGLFFGGVFGPRRSSERLLQEID